MASQANVVICGSGIAGVSAAYHLSVRHGIRDVVVVDERPPLSLTSDKSTECYRNWWPGPGDAMVRLMNRSIDLMERLAAESGNVFRMNRRGYLYLTADPAKIPGLIEAAQEPPRLGAGPLRVHDGSAGAAEYIPPSAEEVDPDLTGADLLLDTGLIRKHFPYLSSGVAAALHARRAGWFSAQQLGMLLLERARQAGVRWREGRIAGVELDTQGVCGVRLADGERIGTRIFVNAAGPLASEVGRMLGVELPIHCELHLKVAFKDSLKAVPREAPLLIWTDAQFLPWTEEERELLGAAEDTAWLLREMPPGAHTRPEGGRESDIALMLWEYHVERVEPTFPPRLDVQYPEIALRGLTAMLPALRGYFGKSPRPILDGGYYCKTQENRPLIGPLPVKGAYVIAALSGFGLMASCAAGELLAAHAAGSFLPPYAPAFSLERYSDPAYRKLLESWTGTGQL